MNGDGGARLADAQDVADVEDRPGERELEGAVDVLPNRERPDAFQLKRSKRYNRCNVAAVVVADVDDVGRDDGGCGSTCAGQIRRQRERGRYRLREVLLHLDVEGRPPGCHRSPP